MIKPKIKDIHIEGMGAIDRVIHEPARLNIMAYLYVVKKADFLFMLNQTGLTRGNLSSHMAKLEEAGYVKVEKTFAGKIPQTFYSLTEPGRVAFVGYKEKMQQLLQKLPE